LSLIRIGLYHQGIEENAYARYSRGDSLLWAQPSILDSIATPNISNLNWKFNFVAIEKILWKLKFSPAGSLVVNSEAAETLEQACNQVSEAATSKERQRLVFLANKSLAKSNTNQAAQLFNSYCNYLQEHKLSLVALRQAQGVEKLSLLKTLEASRQKRQKRYFGDEIAAKLFSKKNVSANYLNQRLIIKASLSNK